MNKGSISEYGGRPCERVWWPCPLAKLPVAVMAGDNWFESLSSAITLFTRRRLAGGGEGAEQRRLHCSVDGDIGT